MWLAARAAKEGTSSHLSVLHLLEWRAATGELLPLPVLLLLAERITVFKTILKGILLQKG